jgi:hypothetical protein
MAKKLELEVVNASGLTDADWTSINNLITTYAHSGVC